MRGTWFAGILAPVLGIVGQAEETGLGPTVGHLVTEPFHGLQLAVIDPAKALSWAVWGEGSPANQSVHLALFSVATDAPLWTDVKAEAYDPGFRLLTDWRQENRPMVAVTFRYGAAAAQIELYGLDATDHPIRLDERLGAEIGWTIDTAGRTLLVIYSQQSGMLQPTCFGWDTGSGKLLPQPCPSTRRPSFF
ncbi:MAG: hypothetical protein WCC64_07340 [Aliidongia sp.]